MGSLATCSDIHLATCSFSAFSRRQYSVEYSDDDDITGCDDDDGDVCEMEALEVAVGFVAVEKGRILKVSTSGKMRRSNLERARYSLDAAKENPDETVAVLPVGGGDADAVDAGGFDGEPKEKPFSEGAPDFWPAAAAAAPKVNPLGAGGGSAASLLLSAAPNVKPEGLLSPVVVAVVVAAPPNLNPPPPPSPL